MRICIPTLDDAGLTGTPCDHFGSAPFFTFVDTKTREVDAVRNGSSDHVHGACRPLDFLGIRPIDELVCRGLGRRALARLQDAGVDVFLTPETSVERTIVALEEGRLRQMSADEACGGHGHGHAHSHGHGHGRGGCQ